MLLIVCLATILLIRIFEEILPTFLKYFHQKRDKNSIFRFIHGIDKSGGILVGISQISHCIGCSLDKHNTPTPHGGSSKILLRFLEN